MLVVRLFGSVCFWWGPCCSSFYFFCVVLLCVFTFLVPFCNVRYDFRIKTMFGSSLSPVVCRRAHLKNILFFVYVCVQGCPTFCCCLSFRFLCCVCAFLSFFFVFVLCLVYPMLPVASCPGLSILHCPFDFL